MIKMSFTTIIITFIILSIIRMKKLSILLFMRIHIYLSNADSNKKYI